MEILRRAERAIVRAMCGVNPAEKKNTTELMDMLGLRETIDGLAKPQEVRWYGHVLRREEDNVLKRALRFTVEGQRRRGRPRKTWKRQVEDSNRTVGLKEEDALDRAKWKGGAKLIAPGVRCIRHPH